MTHLSDLPPWIGGASLRVFRYYSCNNVISEDLTATERKAISAAADRALKGNWDDFIK